MSMQGTNKYDSDSDCHIFSDNGSQLSPDRQDVNMEQDIEEMDTSVKNTKSEKITVCIARPEKIILCVDTITDTSNVPFNVFKKSIEMFVKLKNQINKDHEYALVSMTSKNAEWLTGFTKNPKEINSALDSLDDMSSSEESYNMDNVFDVITEHMDEIINNEDLNNLVLRIIIFYCRSKCIPEFPSSVTMQSILSHFFMDILWTHELNCDSNKVEEISKIIKPMNQFEKSYIFNINFSLQEFNISIAKLLAHPLQRPLQKDFNSVHF